MSTCKLLALVPLLSMVAAPVFAQQIHSIATACSRPVAKRAASFVNMR